MALGAISKLAAQENAAVKAMAHNPSICTLKSLQPFNQPLDMTDMRCSYSSATLAQHLAAAPPNQHSLQLLVYNRIV